MKLIACSLLFAAVSMSGSNVRAQDIVVTGHTGGGGYYYGGSYDYSDSGGFPQDGFAGAIVIQIADEMAALAAQNCPTDPSWCGTAPEPAKAEDEIVVTAPAAYQASYDVIDQSYVGTYYSDPGYYVAPVPPQEPEIVVTAPAPAPAPIELYSQSYSPSWGNLGITPASFSVVTPVKPTTQVINSTESPVPAKDINGKDLSVSTLGKDTNLTATNGSSVSTRIQAKTVLASDNSIQTYYTAGVHVKDSAGQTVSATVYTTLDARQAVVYAETVAKGFATGAISGALSYK